MTKITRDKLAEFDEHDPLRSFRDEFYLPDDTIYLDGNSLGALPASAPERVLKTVQEEWGKGLIRSWNDAEWFTAPERIGGKIAKLIGAREDEVIVCDSTSINLFKMAFAALRLRSGRKKIITERQNFPTNIYILQGLINVLDDGHELVLIEDEDELHDEIDENTALVSITHVNFKSGRIWNLPSITKAAHDAGALMLWDLCHTAGAMPVDLNAHDVDFAVGCTYKYLNGGPGAPAYLFVANRLQQDIEPALSGWMGHAAPFEMKTDYEPKVGIRRNIAGTPLIISMASLEASLNIFERADLNQIRDKSSRLGQLFIDLVEQECGDFNFGLASPREAELRGSQASLTHEEGYAIMQALIARNVIGDFRAPNILRFGFTPLYTRYTDIFDAISHLRNIMETEEWNQEAFKKRALVT